MASLIEMIFLIPLTLMVGYICFFSLAAALFPKEKIQLNPENDHSNKTIAILVPAYKEDDVIVSTAQQLLQSKYPSQFFRIFIIADSLEDKTIKSLKELPVGVIEVKFNKSTKSRALNAALNKIEYAYDIALICDADNVLHPNFLNYINSAFQRGSLAIQGQRVAKNLDSRFSILDGASEMVNNHIFRKGHSAVGLSSSVIGSGMCFSYSMFKDVMKEIDAVGGFDKVLQLELARRNIRIDYVENAIIFDEKIPHSQAFSTQRKRWLSSQFIYLKKYTYAGFKMLLKGKIDYFNLAVLHNIILPRIILLGILPILLVLSLLLNGKFSTLSIAWSALCICYSTALLIALPKTFFRRQFLNSVLSLPQAFLIMIRSLLNIKGANRTFIHTAHNKQNITNPLYSTDDI